MCTDYMGLVHYCRALIARQTRVKFQLVRSSSKRRRQVTSQLNPTMHREAGGRVNNI